MVRRVDAATNWLHRDHLSSVRLMTDAAGAQVAENRYRAYGERTDVQLDPATLRESKGWIGERDDPETGLAYLNARYYDPVLARFIQPDWWDPTDPKVGTNRYAYGLNNPILHKDPSGNQLADTGPGDLLGGLIVGLVAAIDSLIDMQDNGKVDGSQGLGLAHSLNGIVSAGIYAADDAISLHENSDDNADGSLDNDGVDLDPITDQDKKPEELESEKQAKRMSTKELEKAARNNGYDDAHDLKSDYGLGKETDIYVDRSGEMYEGPRKGTGRLEPLGINKDGQ